MYSFYYNLLLTYIIKYNYTVYNIIIQIIQYECVYTRLLVA